MCRDAIERALHAMRVALNDTRQFKNRHVERRGPIQHPGKDKNPVNSLSVDQQVLAAWGVLCGFIGAMSSIEGASVQSVAGNIGRRLKDMCGGAECYGTLGYERAGLVLVDWFAHITGWVEERTGAVAFGRVTRETNSIHVTQKFLDDTNDGNAFVEFMERKPMLVPPVAWTPSARDGGYLYAPVQAVRGVRKGIGSETIVAALNALQGTPWRINTRVLEVAREIERKTAIVQGYELEERHDVTPEMRGQFISSAITLAAFEELKDAEAFWFPWNLDWRGRMYPATSLISPQGSDLCKGLLEFATGTELGRDAARWLAIHLCNVAGEDRVTDAAGRKINRTPDEREQWTIEHTEDILSVAADPLANRSWLSADKPYQYLAACIEWAGYVEQGDLYESRLAGALDGSCSGVQMLSGMTLDESAGAMVNLTPTTHGEDYYRTMAEALQARLLRIADSPSERDLEHLKFWSAYEIGRDLLKAPSMTKVYSAGQFTFAEQVQKKTGAPERECLWLARQINECFGDVAPGMLAAMTYLRDVSGVLTEAGHPLTWTTPAGLAVTQERMTEEQHRLKTIGPDGVERKRMFRVTGTRLDKQKQSAGVSPNFVHGVDASHMAMTINALYARGVRNFWMIHDSFGAPFAQCGDVFDATRETFVELMSVDRLDAWTQQVAGPIYGAPTADKLPALPPRGTLDLSAVRDSTYAWF